MVERSKKYESYSDEEIVKLTSANLPLRSQSYLKTELEIRGLEEAAKEKKIAEIKSKRSFKMVAFMLVIASLFAFRMYQRYF